MGRNLHVVHIPKCGGLVLNLLSEELESLGVSVYGANNAHTFSDFSSYKFSSWHFGSTFFDQPDTDYAVILRDPVDRSISNFLWMYKLHVPQRLGGIYSNNSVSLLDKLRYYLFEDEFYFDHRNLQTRFLCNKVTDYAMNTYYLRNNWDALTQEELESFTSNLTRTKNWYLEDTVMSLDIAKSNLDKCSIVATVETHSSFIENIHLWVETNLGVDVRESYRAKLEEYSKNRPISPYYNYSYVADESQGKSFSTQDLRNLLSQSEIDKVYGNNSLDLELYRYAKDKK